MGTIYNYAASKSLNQAISGGSVNWSIALIDSGKAVSQITLSPLSADEVNAIISKLDMMFENVQDQVIANNVAEELPNILTTVQLVKWQTQSAFGGILAQGTQLDIWPLRAKDVGGTLLNPAATGAKGLYGGTSAGVYSWATFGQVGGTTAHIIPSQTMWQYAGMLYLGAFEAEYSPIMEGIQFTLAGIAAPPQPLTRNIKTTFGENSIRSYTRFEKPVIIPPLKQQAVDVMPADSGDTNLEILGIVVAQSQNKTL